MANPTIGIVAKHLHPSKSIPHLRSNLINDEIVDSLMFYGATPLAICYPSNPKLIPAAEVTNSSQPHLIVENQENFELVLNQLNLCDGLIFQGGQYVDPYEIAIARYAYDHDIPTLGICSGQYALAAIFGPDYITVGECDPDKHDRPCDYFAHSITTKTDTLFQEIVGTYKIMVNSRHKTTIKSCRFLTASAIDEDYNAEVLEAEDKNFYLGVRFHPESLVPNDHTMGKIFTALINACNP